MYRKVPMTPRIRCPLGIAAVVLLLAPGLAAASEKAKETESEPFTRLSVDEVEKRLVDPNVHVYDGNTDELYRKGHVPGAVHLLSKEIKEGILPPEKDAPLIFYCHNEL